MTALSTWLVAHGSSVAELLGFLSGALCVYLVTRQSIWNWPLGIITAAAYIVVFARAGLYSDTGLQAVYLVLSFYGWWYWTRGTVRTTDAGLPVTRAPRSMMLLLLGLGLAGWLALYFATSRMPGVRSPLLDAALTSTSLVAQYMMTRKYLENWLLWIGVDIVYIGLFIVRDLRLTAVLYAVYLTLAILGYIKWNRSSAQTSHASS